MKEKIQYLNILKDSLDLSKTESQSMFKIVNDSPCNRGQKRQAQAFVIKKLGNLTKDTFKTPQQALALFDSWIKEIEEADMSTESIDIIYTYEKGQMATTLKLHRLSNIFLSKKEMERQLLLFGKVLGNGSVFVEGKRKPIVNAKLVKISICIYSKSNLPSWYGDWDGKFYYPLPD